jgi:hypothetical protein
MSYPANKPHRRNRRRFGKNQYPTSGNVGVTVTGTGSTVTLTYASPVNVSGNPALTVATLTISSYVITSPTVITVTMSGTVATHAWTLAANDPHVTSYYGGATMGGSGTF